MAEIAAARRSRPGDASLATPRNVDTAPLALGPASDDEGGIDSGGEDEDISGTSPVTNIGDALQRVKALVRAQTRSAVRQNTLNTQALGRDRSVRMGFYTLLPPGQQRTLFLDLMTESDLWPRARHLFGAPPYDFLEPGDMSRFAASGFARGRANMAHDEVRTVANYTQFGQGHFVDAYRREYKVVRQGRDLPRDSDPLLFDFNAGLRSDVLIMHVRVRRTTRVKRREALADSERRKTVTFPGAGETVQLSLTKQMLQILLGANEGGDTVSDEVRSTKIRVARIVLRGRSANTAAMVAVVV